MSRAQFEPEHGWAVPVVERAEPDQYGVGRYHWTIVATRAGAKFPRPIVFTVRTAVCRRSSARHIAKDVLAARNYEGFHFIACHLTHTEKELHS